MTKPIPTPIPKPPYRSRLEAQYAARLQWAKLAGTIAAWAYEPDEIELAPGVVYTPDFRVTRLDGEVEYHETKGWHQNVRESRLRWRLAASLYPQYRWYWVTLSRRGGWCVREHKRKRQHSKAV